MSWTGDIFKYEFSDVKDIINLGYTRKELYWEEKMCERLDVRMACRKLHLKWDTMSDIDCQSVADWLNGGK